MVLCETGAKPRVGIAGALLTCSDYMRPSHCVLSSEKIWSGSLSKDIETEHALGMRSECDKASRSLKT